MKCCLRRNRRYHGPNTGQALIGRPGKARESEPYYDCLFLSLSTGRQRCKDEAVELAEGVKPLLACQLSQVSGFTESSLLCILVSSLTSFIIDPLGPIIQHSRLTYHKREREIKQKPPCIKPSASHRFFPSMAISIPFNPLSRNVIIMLKRHLNHS